MKTNTRTIFLAAFVAVLCAFATVKICVPKAGGKAAEAHKETAFERVARTGTLRCGYMIYAPNFMQDVNKKEFSGIFHDTVEAMGKELNLKIVWQEEAAYDNLIEGLKSGRFDAICSGLWENPAKAAFVDTTDPLFFNELAVYARADDTRFDYALDKLNDESVTFAVIEGAMADQIAKSDYPKAKRNALPPLSDFPQLLMEVSAKKADVTISATQEILVYDQNNQTKLRKVITDKPFRVFPNVIFVRKGENELVSMLNSALHQVNYTGRLDAIIISYEKQPGTLLRLSDSYKTPSVLQPVDAK